MSFQFKKNKVYEMPVFFGPMPGTKNMDADGKYILKKPADVEALTVMFETNPAQLEALLPDGFSLNAPVLSVAECEFANVGYFNGNTYTLLNISVPVHYDGAEDHLDGDLILVMFENHADPIVGGRDLLGYNKIYADIPRFVKDGRTIRGTASSWGFKFMDLELELDQPAEEPAKMKELAALSKGKFNYKYIQSTPYREVGYGNGGADVCYPTFNPKTWTKPEGYPFTLRKPEVHFCTGHIQFHDPRPDDMPNYLHIAQYLAKLEIKRSLGAQHSLYNDPCDYSHVCRLKELTIDNKKEGRSQ